VDDMMRFMFGNFSDESYDIDDVERELSNLNTESQKDFFSRYIVGVEKLPLSQYLELANIETIQENGQTVFRIRAKADQDKSEIRSGLFGQ
jgi:predicted metalloprotease with PDZ domain